MTVNIVKEKKNSRKNFTDQYPKLLPVQEMLILSIR